MNSSLSTLARAFSPSEIYSVQLETVSPLKGKSKLRMLLCRVEKNSFCASLLCIYISIYILIYMTFKKTSSDRNKLQLKNKEVGIMLLVLVISFGI